MQESQIERISRLASELASVVSEILEMAEESRAADSDGGAAISHEQSATASSPRSVRITPLAGYGTDSSFGADGPVVQVTNLLDDNRPGSLRHAFQMQGPRKVEIKVSGVIPALTPIVPKSKMTVIGEEAPGTGVFVQATPENALATIKIVEPDMHFSNIGFLQSAPKAGSSVRSRDTISIGAGARRIAFNHVTAAWGSDETIQVWSTNRDAISDITFQYCLVAEALSQTGHPSGEHSKGMLIGKFVERVSLHHCVFVGNTRRNPRVHADLAQIVQCVVIANDASDGTTFRPLAIGSHDGEQRYDIIGCRVYGEDGIERGCHRYPTKLMDSSMLPKIHAQGNIGPGRKSNAQPQIDFFSQYGRPINDKIHETPFCEPDVASDHSSEGDELRDFLFARAGNHSWNRHELNSRFLSIQPDTAGTVNAPPEGILY